MVIQSSPTPKVQFQEFGEGGEVLTKCLIYSQGLLTFATLAVQNFQFSQQCVTSESTVSSQSSLCSGSGFFQVSCHLTLSMCTSVVKDSRGSLCRFLQCLLYLVLSSLLPYTTNYCHFSRPKLSSQSPLPPRSQLSVKCSRSTDPHKKKPKTEKQSQFCPLLICVPSVQDHSLGLAVV